MDSNFSKKDIYNITKDNLIKYFTELEPTYIEDGPAVKKLRTYIAKALTTFQEETDFSPIVEIGKGQFISIEKVKGKV